MCGWSALIMEIGLHASSLQHSHGNEEGQELMKSLQFGEKVNSGFNKGTKHAHQGNNSLAARSMVQLLLSAYFWLIVS